MPIGERAPHTRALASSPRRCALSTHDTQLSRSLRTLAALLCHHAQTSLLALPSLSHHNGRPDQDGTQWHVTAGGGRRRRRQCGGSAAAGDGSATAVRSQSQTRRPVRRRAKEARRQATATPQLSTVDTRSVCSTSARVGTPLAPILSHLSGAPLTPLPECQRTHLLPLPLRCPSMGVTCEPSVVEATWPTRIPAHMER